MFYSIQSSQFFEMSEICYTTCATVNNLSCSSSVTYLLNEKNCTHIKLHSLNMYNLLYMIISQQKLCLKELLWKNEISF